MAKERCIGDHQGKMAGAPEGAVIAEPNRRQRLAVARHRQRLDRQALDRFHPAGGGVEPAPAGLVSDPAYAAAYIRVDAPSMWRQLLATGPLVRGADGVREDGHAA